MSNYQRRTMLKTVGGIAIVGTLAGCADDPEPESDPDDDSMDGDDGMEDEPADETEDETETDAALRVTHLSPDAPNVDVYVDGDAVLEDVPFRAASDYLELPAGEYDVMITAAGDADTVVFDETLALSDDEFTAAAVGELAEENQPFGVEVYEDDVSDPGEMARVRLVHASPDAPNVDVTVDGEPLFTDVPFGAAGTVEVPADDYELEVRPATEGGDGDVVATFDVSPEAGTVYTAFAVGYLAPEDAPADEPFDLELVVDASYDGGGDVPEVIDEFLADALLYDGTIADHTGEDEVVVAVGAGDGLAFDPPAIRIDAGATVRWEWTGEGGAHNVVSTEESSTDFDSGDAVDDPDEVFEQSFDDDGIQLYVCTPHRGAGMLGAIDVVE